MDFRTTVDIPKGNFEIEPCEDMLFVGSCFADNLGHQFQENQFHALVNPYGVMYNPVSVKHTIEKLILQPLIEKGGKVPNVNDKWLPKTVVMTLGTNHVYILKETGEIVDNCQKRPQRLFEEKALTVDACADALSEAIELLNKGVRFLLTVSPIRYRKYGYHGSQLSKATLLLAADEVCRRYPHQVDYFPAYEIVNDELRDYRFYADDMLHPSSKAVEYIWERFVDAYLSDGAKAFLKEWEPLKAALQHRPFHPDSQEYKDFMNKTMLKVGELSKKYPNFALQKQYL